MRTLFSGRLGRRTYAVSFAALYGALLGAVFVVALILGLIADFAGLESETVDLVLMIVPFIVFYIYRFSLDSRRFHDLGYSGFFSLLRVIPLLGIVVFGYLLLKKGDEGSNSNCSPRYGVAQRGASTDPPVRQVRTAAKALNPRSIPVSMTEQIAA
jgi:uncharacterized membrane protein YhaH (DUF805 family)